MMTCILDVVSIWGERFCLALRNTKRSAFVVNLSELVYKGCKTEDSCFFRQFENPCLSAEKVNSSVNKHKSHLQEINT